MRHLHTRFIAAALVAGLSCAVLSCAAPPPGPDPVETAATERAIREALDRYMVAARAVDPAAIARSFTTTATLFEPGIKPIVSRDAIQAFVASFRGVRVEVATATPDEIEIFGATALVWGSYFERLDFPGQPQSEQHGKFVMEWVRQADGAWLIHRYFRVPAPG